MVAKPRTSADTVDRLQAFEDKPHEFDYFSLLRHLECLYQDKPRLGEAARPADEPVRLGQEPSLAFAPSALAAFRVGDGSRPHRLSQYFFGLFGANGPLPLHLTEYAREREKNERDPTFRRFADIFHHRLLLMFYRAWADANPATTLDRLAPRRFDAYVGSVFGVGIPELANRDAVPDSAKLYLAGLLGLKTRPAAALAALLKEFMQLPFRVRQFVGAWMRLPAEDWSGLGVGPGGARLGLDTVLGRSIWTCQHRFRLTCGPLGFVDFERLLPGRESLAKLRDLVRNYVGEELEWDLNLVLVGRDVPGLRLGMSGELGWTTWLGRRRSAADADDVVIHPNASSAKKKRPMPRAGE